MRVNVVLTYVQLADGNIHTSVLGIYKEGDAGFMAGKEWQAAQSARSDCWWSLINMVVKE
jgi:hypothetical protein